MDAHAVRFASGSQNTIWWKWTSFHVRKAYTRSKSCGSYPHLPVAANGVEFLDYTEGPLATTGHIAQLGPARAAWFRDPDGNTLGLRQG